MNMSRKTGFSASFTVVAAASLLMAGCAMGSKSSTSDPSMHGSYTSMQGSSTSMGSGASMNRFGGPVYSGKPALAVTVALVQAGGGAGNFSLVTALNHMLGAKTVKAEVAKLTKQYGSQRVGEWVHGMDFYIADTLKIVKAKGITLPPPAQLSGVELAKALVGAGTAPDGTFWAGYLFDHAVSHPIHNQLMVDADAKYSAAVDATAHSITNQAFYDVAQALGMTHVKLAPYHS